MKSFVFIALVVLMRSNVPGSGQTDFLTEYSTAILIFVIAITFIVDDGFKLISPRRH